MSAHSFKKVARGGALFTMGSFFGSGLQFVAGIIVIRIVTPSEYGLISLAMVVAAFLVGIVSLGLPSGLPRLISKHHGSGEGYSFIDMSGTSLVILSVTSIFIAISLYWTADTMAAALNKPDVADVLRVLSLMIPPVVIIELLTGMFRGLQDVKPKILFQDISIKALRILGFSFVAFLGLGFDVVVWIYVLSAWITLAIYGFYTIQKLRDMISLKYKGDIAKHIVLFSLPLLGVSLMGNLMTWVGTMSVGYFQTAEEVAYFSVPYRLVNFIPLPLVALVFIYLPVATKLIHGNEKGKLKELYASSTKWAFFMTLPLLVYFLLDAEYLLLTLFGEEYMHSGDILRLLVLGYATHSFLGPNGTTLIAYGDTRTVFISTLLGALVMIVLCLLLVPEHGAFGAAAGTATAYFLMNIYTSTSLYISYKIHPFSKSYILPLMLIVVIVSLISLNTNIVLTSHWIIHLSLFFAILVVVTIAPFLTKSITHDDIDILKAIERRIHGKTNLIEWVDRHTRVYGDT